MKWHVSSAMPPVRNEKNPAVPAFVFMICARSSMLSGYMRLTTRCISLAAGYTCLSCSCFSSLLSVKIQIGRAHV